MRRASLAVRTLTIADLTNQPDPGIAAIAGDLAAERHLSEGERPFAAPRFWAPFALVGGWS